MAITSYSTLKTAIADWLDRDDLDTQIDTFIDMTEAKLARDLRIKAMDTALSGTIASGVVAVPADYLELQFAYVDGNPTVWLDMKAASWIYGKYPTRAADSRPQFIAREGTNFIFGPYPDSGYTIKGLYYAKLAALSGSNETNWFTDNAPDLLLYGSLLAATPYLGDDARAMVWKVQYDEAIESVKDQDRNERWPARANLRMTAS